MAGEQGAKGCLPALGFSDSAEGWVSEFGETSAHSSTAGGCALFSQRWPCTIPLIILLADLFACDLYVGR